MVKKQFGSKIKNSAGILLLACFDLFILFSIVYSTMALRKTILPFFCRSMPTLESQPPEKYFWLFPVWIAVLAYNGVYTKRFAFWDEVKTLWKTTFIVAVAVFAFLFIGKESVRFSRTIILTISMLSLLFFPVVRPFIKRGLYKCGLLRRKLLILGSGEAARMAFNTVRKERNLGYEVAGFLSDKEHSGERIEGIKVHGFMDGADRYVKKCGIHDVMIADPDLDKERLVTIINKVQHKAENTLYMPEFSGIAVLGTELRNFFGQQALVIEIKNNLVRPVNYVIKKLFDFILGIICLITLFFPFLFMAALIKLSSRGPAVFKHARVGKKCRQFMCYKFRTMHMDAEERLAHVLQSDPAAKAEWLQYRKLKNDPRVTRLGKFLRETSLDELPQILNVLKGQMSFVGPRPVTREELDLYYKTNSDFCFRVLPGITGLWQVSGRNEMGYEKRILLDMWYVRNWNIWLDIVILFKTVRTVTSRKGAS